MKKQFINEPCIFYMGKYIKGVKKMSDEKKSNVVKWLNFAIGALSIVGKVLVEIIEMLPKKNNIE